MLKLIGVVLIAGGCTLWGVQAAHGLSVRVQLLEALVCAVQVLERELTLFRPALPDLLERMAQGQKNQVATALNACKAAIEKGKSFTDVWEQEMEKLPLNEREKGLLRGLGQILGRYDDGGQVQAAAHVREELERCAEVRRRDNLTRGGMYRALGATFGGFLVLSLL